MKKIILICLSFIFISCDVAIYMIAENSARFRSLYNVTFRPTSTFSLMAKTQIKNIVQASEIYKMENDSYPPDCWETLKEEDYLEIKESITKKWEFECSFDEDGEGGTVSATSTKEMRGGAGHRIRYDKETGKFRGYGQSNR